MQTKAVNPWTWQDPYSFSQAVEFTGGARQLVCSGQAAVDADGNPLHAGNMAAQLAAALDNLETVLAAAGMGLANVVRLNYYTTDIAAYLAASPEVGRRFAAVDCKPAGTLLGVKSLFHPDVMIEIEATAIA